MPNRARAMQSGILFGMNRLLVIAVCVAGAAVAHAGETDQFMTWGVVLEDSAPAVNEYLNREVAAYLATPQADAIALQSDLAEAIFRYLFQGLYASRFRNWIHHSPEVDRFPDRSTSWWEYQSQSIYNRLSFPYILPMSRTVRIGDVYTGIDKFGHFFGFGRRFYIDYARLRAAGLSEQAACEEVVLDAIHSENLFVGKLVDGIFSSADIEAGYQGMLLCRDLADETMGYIGRTESGWHLAEPIDLRKYVTPEYDESYNPCHYWGLRKRFVIPTLRERYGEMVASDAVQQRFRRYARHPESFCSEVIARHFGTQKDNPQREQYRAAFGRGPEVASRGRAFSP